MTKLIKIILWILIAVIIILITYSAAIQNKVNAQQEIIDQQQPIVDAANRISELEDLIKEEQTKYQLALDSKKECEVSWTKQMNKAHEKADEYRAEQLKLQGLIMSR
jgi:type II secretory pathway pseudopilin PulG